MLPSPIGRLAAARGRRGGFTLLEMLIVVGIVAILAAVAIPSYMRTVERAYWSEAQDLLLTIYYGERSYSFRNGLYRGGLGPSSAMAEWQQIFMDNPNISSIPVQFDVPDCSPNCATQFTATATRTGSGLCGSKTLTIDQTRALSSPGPCWAGCSC